MHFIVSYTLALKISSSCFTLNFLFLRFFRSHSPGYFIIFRWFSEVVFMLNGLFWHCIILAVFSKPCIGGDAHWSYPISPCFTCSKWRIRFYIFCSNSHFVESGLVRNDGDGRCFLNYNNTFFPVEKSIQKRPWLEESKENSTVPQMKFKVHKFFPDH